MKAWVLMHKGKERSPQAVCSPNASNNIRIYEPTHREPECPNDLQNEWVEVDLTFPCQHTMAYSKCGATS